MQSNLSAYYTQYLAEMMEHLIDKEESFFFLTGWEDRIDEKNLIPLNAYF